jgi:tetratricopeptide (TPR) repeat protein
VPVQELQRRAIELVHQGQSEAALAVLEGAITQDAGRVELHLLRGDVLAVLRRYGDALDAYRAARAIEPGNVRAQSSEGTALLRLGQPDAALASFERALTLAPQVPGTWYNRGLAYAGLNRAADALADFDKAIAISGDYALAHVNRGMLLLLTGRYREGFAEFEWRFGVEPGSRELRAYRSPRWRKGNAIAGKRVLLYAEQGMGDVIQFARFIPQVAASAAQVTLEVQPSLVRLLQGLPCEIVALGTESVGFNLHSPLVSLGHLLDVQMETIPSRVPYLTAPAEDVARWRAKLGALDGKLKVGLVWSGNPEHNNDFNRSIPFERMKALLDVPDVAFVSLQKDVREADRPALQRAGILDAGAELGDFADAAALIENLDLVISADTAVAHLAGALGKKVWLLLPFAPDWRWMLERSDSAWYPSATLFRQSAPGNWGSVMGEVKRWLESIAMQRA